MSEPPSAPAVPTPAPDGDPVDPDRPGPLALAPAPSARLTAPAVDVPAAPEAPALLDDALADARMLVTGRPELGRLGPLVVWLAGVQGASPPRPFRTPVALVVAARHDEARFVGRLPESALADRVASLDLDLPLRVLDLGDAGPWFVRASGADIRTGDALTADEALRAFALGRLAADREVDGGADVLLVGDLAVEDGPAVAALAAVLTRAQPHAVVGRRGLSPPVWMRTVEVVRDARARGSGLDRPLDLLAALGGADLACLAGILVQAAQRRTPVLLSGPAAHVAGVAAEAYAGGSSLWWTSASSSGDPAEAAAVAALELAPLLDLDLGLDGCGGAVLALGVVQGLLTHLQL